MNSLEYSAPVYDDITASVMKTCLNEYMYIAPLTYLVNSFIKHCISSDELIIAKFSLPHRKQ